MFLNDFYVQISVSIRALFFFLKQQKDHEIVLFLYILIVIIFN